MIFLNFRSREKLPMILDHFKTYLLFSEKFDSYFDIPYILIDKSSFVWLEKAPLVQNPGIIKQFL